MLYVAYEEWAEYGLLSFKTYSELMDHGIDPDALVITFNDLKQVNKILKEEGGEHA